MKKNQFVLTVLLTIIMFGLSGCVFINADENVDKEAIESVVTTLELALKDYAVKKDINVLVNEETESLFTENVRLIGSKEPFAKLSKLYEQQLLADNSTFEDVLEEMLDLMYLYLGEVDSTLSEYEFLMHEVGDLYPDEIINIVVAVMEKYDESSFDENKFLEDLDAELKAIFLEDLLEKVEVLALYDVIFTIWGIPYNNHWNEDFLDAWDTYYYALTNDLVKMADNLLVESEDIFIPAKMLVVLLASEYLTIDSSESNFGEQTLVIYGETDLILTFTEKDDKWLINGVSYGFAPIIKDKLVD